MKIWDLRAELNRYLPRMKRRFCQLNYGGMHQRRVWRFFHFWGLIPRAPNFAEFHARGGGGRLPVMPGDLIPPWGSTLLHGEAKKPTTAVGVVQPSDGLVGAVGLAFGRRTAATGGGGGLGGQFLGGVKASFGVFGGKKSANGGGRRCWRMQKSHTQAASQGAVVPAGAGVPGKTGGRTAFFRGAPGKNQASPGRKGAFGRPSGAALAGVGGKKAPFCRKSAGRGAVLGRKLAGRACGA